MKQTTSTPTTGATVSPAGDDLVLMPASRLASLVRARQVRPLDVVDAHLRRIEAVDPGLGAFVAVCAAAARREAAALGERDALERLPLAGVPVAIKDNVDVAGEPTRQGSRATHSEAAAQDDELVSRLRAAGAVVIGKTALPELAVWPFTEPEIQGPTRNPWDASRTPGGSTGGGAVAVATGMAALALGSDGGGSIRIPAACCGVVGVKPTPGLVPLAGGGADHWYGLSAFGPLARTVADAALMLDVLAGGSAFRDPGVPPTRLRIAVSTKHPMAGATSSAAIRAAIDVVARALTGAGHDLRRENPPYPLSPLPFGTRWLAGIAQDTEGLDPRELEARTRAQARIGRWIQRRGLATPVRQSTAGARLRAWVEHRDVLLTPVLATAPARVGAWRGKGWIRTTLGISRWMGFTPPWNLAAVPGMTVPIGVATDGLPIAVQLVAAPGREAVLLSLAAQLETLVPARQWRPDLVVRS